MEALSILRRKRLITAVPLFFAVVYDWNVTKITLKFLIIMAV